jgi:hypothetical protein
MRAFRSFPLAASLTGLGSLLVFCGDVTGADGQSALRRGEIEEFPFTQEVRMDIGKLVAAGKVQPASAVGINKAEDGHWLLRTPNAPPEMRWPRNLLNWRAGAPDLTIDPGLTGTYDIYAEVRAVDGGPGAGAKPDDAAPMAFALELDDGSKREIVGAKGFPGHHYDTEVMASHGWDLTGRKIVVHSLGKPVYLMGFRFVPTDKVSAKGSSHQTTRWLARDHVTIVKEQGKHFAFPGVALLKNGDLVVVYREATIHMPDPTGKISLSRSTDGGRTWLPRVTALDRPNFDDRDPSIFQMSDGTVLLLSSDSLCTSTDGAHTWSEPLPTPVFGPRGAVEDEEGNIVYGGLNREVQKGELTHIGSRSVFLKADAAYRSRNKGQSWEAVGVAAYTTYIPGAMDYVWLDEPFMCVVPHQYWIFGARVDLDGFARIIRSPDRGRTWEAPIKTPVWGFPQHLLPLRDGRLLMSYGYRRPPYGVRACLSYDNGKTWDLANEIVLRADGGTPEGQPAEVGSTDLGYPASVQLADGRIFTVYYLNSGGSNCYIAGTLWELPTKSGTSN